MERSFRQKINMEIADLSNTIDQMHQTDIYRTFHPIIFHYTLFSSTLGNILQDRTFVQPQNKWQQIGKDKIILCLIL